MRINLNEIGMIQNVYRTQIWQNTETWLAHDIKNENKFKCNKNDSKCIWYTIQTKYRNMMACK